VAVKMGGCWSRLCYILIEGKDKEKVYVAKTWIVEEAVDMLCMNEGCPLEQAQMLLSRVHNIHCKNESISEFEYENTVNIYRLLKGLQNVMKTSGVKGRLRPFHIEPLLQNFGIPKYIVKELLEGLDENKDGWITADEFVIGIELITIAKEFKFLDEGRLQDKHAILQKLKQQYGSNSEYEKGMQTLFQDYMDASKDNKPDFADFVTSFFRLQLKNVFDYADADHDGKISRKEIWRLANLYYVPSKKKTEFFDEIDKNGDSHIDFEEFFSYFQHDQHKKFLGTYLRSSSN